MPTPLFVWHSSAPTLRALRELERATDRCGRRIDHADLVRIMRGEQKPTQALLDILHVASAGGISRELADWYELSESWLRRHRRAARSA